MLHAVATHLRINLQEARCGFGLFGRHSYSTVLVMKILNVSGIRNGQNPVLLGNTVQRSQDIQQNAWIIAEDFEEQRYCCINVNVDDIQSVFCNLSNRIHNLLERHYR